MKYFNRFSCIKNGVEYRENNLKKKVGSSNDCVERKWYNYTVNALYNSPIGTVSSEKNESKEKVGKNCHPHH